MKTKPPPLRDGGSEGIASTGNDALNSPPTPSNPRTDGSATGIYYAIIAELERRRIALQIPMEKFSEFAGLPDRYWPKACAPHTPSGRQANWPTLQVAVSCLFPDGFDLRIIPRHGPSLDRLRFRYALKYDRQFADGKTRRQILSEWGTRGGRANSTEHLKKIARLGGEARARKYSLNRSAKLARQQQSKTPNQS